MKTRYLLMLSAACLVAFGFVAYRDFEFIGCGTELYETLPSPDGKYGAVAFGVDCGATTGFNTQLSILPPGAVLDRDDHPSLLILDDKWDLEMRWADNTHLLVTIPKSAHVYKKEDRGGDISVIYD